MLASQHCSEVIWYHRKGWTVQLWHFHKGFQLTFQRYIATYMLVSSESLLQSITSWVWQFCLQIRGVQSRSLQWGWLRAKSVGLWKCLWAFNTQTLEENMCTYLQSTPTPVFRQAKKCSTCTHYLSINSIDLNHPLLPALSIPPPPAHCIHSWEHWPPPLWKIANEQIVYALAVCVHPYPNHALWVWLYTASLIPK